jgi:hypothetical protein
MPSYSKYDIILVSLVFRHGLEKNRVLFETCYETKCSSGSTVGRAFLWGRSRA